jgi:hypothetical protein
MSALVVLVLLAVIAGSAYVSTRVTAVVHVTDSYPLRVVAADPTRGTIEITRGQDATEPGTFRLAWPGGQAVIGGLLATTSTTVTRHLSAVKGRLTVGERVGVEPDPYTGNPLSALGLAYTTVEVPGALGSLPAWWLPGRRSTWVILIHGLGGSRADTLPIMATLRTLGYPMLAITYRNDDGAPASPDHRNHLGATEWRDVQSAVTYAARHGATGVVLYGYSLGGAMALVVARDPATRPEVRAIVLDSPVLDWHATFAFAARRDSIPGPVVALTEHFVGWRAHLDYGEFDQIRQARSLTVPVLLIQGDADTVVPPKLASRFAAARPDLITYLPVHGADHVSGIDSDPTAYVAAVEHLLATNP